MVAFEGICLSVVRVLKDLQLFVFCSLGFRLRILSFSVEGSGLYC